MITPKELLEFNQILQNACDMAAGCFGCDLMRKYAYYGCIKDHQENEDEAKILIDFDKARKKELKNEQSNQKS